jgi:hypothetical protein
VFRIGLHATASKSSPRKALFSSVQEQSQHRPKDNFLEENITYQVCLKLMKPWIIKYMDRKLADVTFVFNGMMALKPSRKPNSQKRHV